MRQRSWRTVTPTPYPTGRVQGSVNVSGEGKVYGPAVGVNTGTISGTYTFGDDDKEKSKGGQGE